MCYPLTLLLSWDRRRRGLALARLWVHSMSVVGIEHVAHQELERAERS